MFSGVFFTFTLASTLTLTPLEESESLICICSTYATFSSSSESSSADLIFDNYLTVVLLKSAKFLIGINFFLIILASSSNL